MVRYSEELILLVDGENHLPEEFSWHLPASTSSPERQLIALGDIASRIAKMRLDARRKTGRYPMDSKLPPPDGGWLEPIHHPDERELARGRWIIKTLMGAYKDETPLVPVMPKEPTHHAPRLSAYDESFLRRRYGCFLKSWNWFPFSFVQ